MENVPDSVVGFLLQNLVDFIKSNYELISGAEDSCDRLCDELGNLKGYLQDIYAQNYSSNFLDNLANNVRNLVHRAEDAVEAFLVENSRHMLKGTVKKWLSEGEHERQVRNLAKEIKEIIKDVQEFYTQKAPLGLETIKRENLVITAAKNLKPAVDDTVVGLQDETAKVIDLLTKGTEQLDVISIVGMYGLGKTTLAKKVFNDSQIEYHFFLRAFVEVSQDFKRKEVFLKIINSFGQTSQDVQRMSDDKLADHIKEYLEKRNYLIVLDDVWTREAWDQLKCAFPTNDKRSRILITTREIEAVAKYARKISEPHSMRPLYDNEAKDLLRLKVFDDQKYRLSDDLEVFEAQILRKCDGLPLAIVVIAGTLKSNPKEPRWWKQVAEGVQVYDPSMVREKIEYVIKLSFDRLPYDLKPCFLYLGVFGEDSEIPARTLLRLWVSEGLIPPSKGNITSEDIAEFYLQILVDRSLVMVQKRGSNDQVKTIKIHDTLREFCKARAQKENLFRELKMTGPAATNSDRRLCINSDLRDQIDKRPSGERVRSFLSFAKEDFILPPKDMPSIFRAFKLLRVLDIRSIKLTRFPPDLYYLVLLKYIAIYGELTSLPEKMSNLWNLQTLIVLITGTTLTIRADIWKMAQLRHLETNASAVLLETRDGSKNPNLQTLSTISPESCKKSEIFKRAPMLKKLGIRGKLALLLEDGREIVTLFGTTENLENLKLLNQTAEKISNFPSWNHFPTKLWKLTLLNTLLDWQQVSTLGKLPNLQVLKLKDNACKGEKWITEDGSFKRLKVLHIGKTDLNFWKTSSNHFPVLTRLYIKHCTGLKGIPQDLEVIPTLEMIDLYSTNDKLVASARRLQVAKLGSEKKFKLFVYPPDQ